LSEPQDEPQKGKRRRSLATRQDIIDATIACFIDIGYFRTTTTEIARKAGVTRGAVQHYFPTTEHVLKASVDYLVDAWIEAFYDSVENSSTGKDSIDFAVDNLWAFVNDPLYIAWKELVAAARTDEALREIIEPAAGRYEQVRRDMGNEAYGAFRDAAQEKFSLNRDALRFLLEGMSSSVLTYDKDQRIEAQLKRAKRILHAEWEQEAADQNIPVTHD
jgi:AcrR family transcriptional regulator